MTLKGQCLSNSAKFYTFPRGLGSNMDYWKFFKTERLIEPAWSARWVRTFGTIILVPLHQASSINIFERKQITFEPRSGWHCMSWEMEVSDQWGILNRPQSRTCFAMKKLHLLVPPYFSLSSFVWCPMNAAHLEGLLTCSSGSWSYGRVPGTWWAGFWLHCHWLDSWCTHCSSSTELSLLPAQWPQAYSTIGQDISLNMITEGEAIYCRASEG